jgi:HlyD family secretion protein
MKRRILAPLVAVLAVALFVGFSSTITRADDAAKPKTEEVAAESPKTHKVKADRLKIDVDLKGTFESGKMSPVSRRPEAWSTLIVKKAVPHGAKVKKGEPIVWLETDDLDKAILSAEHGQKLANLSLKQAEADLRVAQETLPLDLKSAVLAKAVADETLVDFMKIDRKRNELATKRSLDGARFSLEYVQEELDQLKKMYEADDLTEETEEIILKRAARSVDSGKFSLESSEIRTERRLERDIPRLQQQLIDAAKRQEQELRRAKLSLPAGLETKRLALEKQRVDQERSREKLANLKKDRDGMIVKSPADGIVYYGRCVRGKWLDKTKADGMLKQGGTLLAKQTFITIVAREPLQVRVDLPEADLSKVKKGLAGTATPTGFSELKVPVKVNSVSYIPLSAGVFDCVLSIDGKTKIGPLMPGMTCKVKLNVYDKNDALTVPPAAVHRDDANKSYVYLVPKKGEHVKRNVVVGKRTDKTVEILKGLKAGDEVLVGKPE